MTILGLADFGSQTTEAFRALRKASKIPYSDWFLDSQFDWLKSKKLGSLKSLIDMTNQGKIRFFSVVSDKPQFHNFKKSNFGTKILFPGHFRLKLEVIFFLK